MGRSKRIYILKKSGTVRCRFVVYKKAKNPLAAAGSKLMGLN